jgi:hypothetical protein
MNEYTYRLLRAALRTILRTILRTTFLIDLQLLITRHVTYISSISVVSVVVSDEQLNIPTAFSGPPFGPSFEPPF